MLAVASTWMACVSAESSDRPNFVFFLVDDLGWGAMSAYGSDYHETPHFDRLCARGMKFSQAYSACTVCSPSRAAILTGRYPARTHLTDWIPGHENRQAKLRIPDWKRYMDHRHTTLAEALRQQGYRTAFMGKWHLVPVNSHGPARAQPTEHFPEAHGFEVNIGGNSWGQPRGRGKYFYPFDMPGLEEGEPGEYLTDRLTDEAVTYLDRQDDAPFLLYMSYYTVHSPLIAKQNDVDYFLAKRRDKDGGRDQAIYAAMHKSFDDSIGRIVAKLDELGKTENTILIFTGDNGGDFVSACGGLRGRKGLAFEGGTRVPTCVVWPGVTEPGSSNDTPIIGMDFFPTLLDMAGLPLLADQHVDGKSLSPLLKQTGRVDRDTLYWHYPHYHRTNPYGAIRHRDWKLIEFFEDGRLMLFDLENDPAEQHNLAESNPDQAAKLLQMLRDWRAEVGAQMPTPNPDYQSKESG